jgi:hypothetical protein
MEFLAELWIPILASGVVVFLLSALAWTAMPHHKKDFGPLPNQDAVMAVMNQNPPAPGQYIIPWEADAKRRSEPAFLEKMNKGPHGYMTVIPNGMPSMGPMMVKSVIYNVVVAVLVGYVAWHALGAGADYLAVFRIVGATAAMSFTLASVPDSVWFGRPWRAYWLQVVDGVVYALFMAGIFGWLWPR